MDILILNWRDIKHPLGGGAEISLFEHAQYWKKKGAHIIWFSSIYEGAPAEEVIDGIKIIRKGSHYTVQARGIFYYLTGKFGKPDVVIDCFHFLPFFTPLYVEKPKIIAIIHEVANKLWFKNLSPIFATIGYFTEPLCFLFYRNIPFITVSESTKKDLLQENIPEKNITVIPNGIRVAYNTNKISKEKIPTILFLGRISKDKGIHDALEVFKLLSLTIPTAQFWIIGREEREGELKLLTDKIIKDRTTKKKLHYFHYVNEEKKLELLKKSWILIHPSHKEGWGLTVIEAASQETPTVGYNVPGLLDSIIDGETGVLVPSNPQAIATAVFQLLEDEKKYKSIAQEAKKWSEEFNWEKSGAMSFELIKKVVSKQ